MALLLVLELTLTYYVQFELMDTLRRLTSKTQSKPMVWSDAYKCCFFFCLLYEMCYFALSLLKNTFIKKKSNNVNVYSILFSFFSATLQENNDLWAF